MSAQHHRDDRRRNVERLIDICLDQVFFEYEFDTVSERLQQAERSDLGGPSDSVCAPKPCAPARRYKPPPSSLQK